MKNLFGILALAILLLGSTGAASADKDKKLRPALTPEVLAATQQAQRNLLITKFRALRERQALSRPTARGKVPVQRPFLIR
ncbi:hypothetical protein BH10PSE7_BH10PSE7_02590 [soil metagenome]